VLFFISVVLFDINGRIEYRNEPLSVALKDSLYYLAVQPIGTAFLLVPYLVLGWFSAKESKEFNIKRGLCFFIPGLLSLSYIYYYGYLAASYFIEHEKWTASALSVGMLPFKSVVALPTGLFVGWLIQRAIYGKRT
jgi:hypothetical protein